MTKIQKYIDTKIQKKKLKGKDTKIQNNKKPPLVHYMIDTLGAHNCGKQKEKNYKKITNMKMTTNKIPKLSCTSDSGITERNNHSAALLKFILS